MRPWRSASLAVLVLVVVGCGAGGDEDDAGFADTGPKDAQPAEDALPVDTGPKDTGVSSVCGNGQVEVGEDCDDGNTTDEGNGCSTQCRRNSTCGNGTVESLFESCDNARSRCCNSTCSGPAAAATTCRDSAGECDAPETCDGAGIECPADRFRDDATACTTCPAAAYCAGCYGGRCADSRTFCAEILARGQSTGHGRYTVHPSATASVAPAAPALSVFCDMTTEGGGWTMVYKKSRTVPGDAGLLWSATATNTDDLSLQNRQLSPRDYNNAFQTLYWPAFTEARVEVVTGTTTAKFIRFDLAGSTPINWFSTTRHRASSWTDLPTDPSFDNGSDRSFRIGSARSFYINRTWGGCPNDRGWLMISTVNTCAWEARTGDPSDVIYSRLTTESLIQDTNQTGYADTFVVFLR